MFSTIFNYELRYWLRQPSVYIYALLLFSISMVTMWGMSSEMPEEIVVWTNSPLGLLKKANFFLLFLLFLLPSIIGMAVYRDFKSDMHTVLYSYPLTKRTYLLAKFFSAFVVVAAIITMVGIGFFVGTQMPGVKAVNLAPFSGQAYLQLYGLYLFPNLLLFGAIVFAVVLFSRNIYAGFVTVILVIVVKGLLGGLLTSLEQGYLAAILDPIGVEAIEYATRYWTTTERNELLVPINQLIVFNRLFWLMVAGLLFGLVYRYFSFSQQAMSFKGRKEGAVQTMKQHFGSLIKVDLPKVLYGFSFWQQLKTSWHFSRLDFRYIVWSWPFLCILLAGGLAVFFQQAEMNPQHGFKLLPVTWRMLHIPNFMFSGVINLLTFLYAGMLVHRTRLAKANQLVDIAPLPNWVFVLSKFLAVVKMQLLLLLLIMMAGIFAQLYKGYYNFEIGHYLFELFGLNLIHYMIWAMLALFIHSLIDNLYLSFFLLLGAPVGAVVLGQLGPQIGLDFLEQSIFQFNQAPNQILGFDYSDMNAYGTYLPVYLIHKLYWLLAGLLLIIGALLFWKRGLTYSFKERFRIARARFQTPLALASTLFFLAFFGLGFGIYYEDNIANENSVTQLEEEQWMVENEKQLKKYEYTIQPRIRAVKMALDIFPYTRDFKIKGSYTLINESSQLIDTLLIGYSFKEVTSYSLSVASQPIRKDSLLRFDVHLLEQSLAPGDSIALHFNVQNKPNSLFRNNSKILSNGTLVGLNVLLRMGYRRVELTNKNKRKKYGLPARETDMPYPTDSASLGYAYSGNNMDRASFETIVSTAADQLAFTPGDLQREWMENGRRYFHYKTNGKIDLSFAFNSGRYQLYKDQWKDVDLKIYHHPTHAYNLESLVDGLKESLDYCTKNFGPFQHKEVRVVEFAKSEGTHATAIGNSMPYSEIYFIGDIDHADPTNIDFPFYVSAHEMAHNWWGKQVDPANVLGGKMVSEGLAEYTALKVLEHKHGVDKMRLFLQKDLHYYLEGRSNERQGETPLIHSRDEQEYINYRKSSLVFYALSDYLGEAKFNAILKRFLENNKAQQPPFATSLSLVDEIKTILPDSLNYLVKDLFETITLYDNSMVDATVKRLENGQYQVDMQVKVGKYRVDEKGRRSYGEGRDSLVYQNEERGDTIYSLPLADYIDVGVFGEVKREGGKEEVVLYRQRHRFTRIHNKLSFVLDQKPVEVGIDPYNKLIDRNSIDNRMKVFVRE